jgi:hypothetical protein
MIRAHVGTETVPTRTYLTVGFGTRGHDVTV